MYPLLHKLFFCFIPYTGSQLCPSSFFIFPFPSFSHSLCKFSDIVYDCFPFIIIQINLISNQQERNKLIRLTKKKKGNQLKFNTEEWWKEWRSQLVNSPPPHNSTATLPPYTIEMALWAKKGDKYDRRNACCEQHLIYVFYFYLLICHLNKWRDEIYSPEENGEKIY